jgi:2-methylcitrate dehydratase
MLLLRRQAIALATGAASASFDTTAARADQRTPLSRQSSGAPLAERLAIYAHELRYEDLGTATVERVKTHLIDGLGCAIAALEERPVRLCREFALAAPGPAAVIGTDRKSSLELATFANTAAVRFLDFNDTFVGKIAVHPSDNIPACLAVAEAAGVSARDFINAIVIAYEVNCRLADAFDISRRGWDPTVFALPAIALASGRLMRLSPQQLTQAVNLALNDHIPMAQTRVGVLSDWKGISVAEAGRNAVFAAQLARAGLTGPAPIFEGGSGFMRQVGGMVEVDVDAFGGRGGEFCILQCGIKPYPAVIYSQTAIVAAIAVAEEVKAVEQISTIEIATSRRGLQRAGSEPEKWAPKTRETADHSLPYLTARAMFDRDITAESFAPEKFADPAILAFMRKITVVEEPEITARVGGRGGAVPTRLTATLSDGSRVVHEVDFAPGFSGRPMTREEVARKFRGNIRGRWSRERGDACLEAVWALDQAGDLSVLLKQIGA